jgi:hypothetical protein
MTILILTNYHCKFRWSDSRNNWQFKITVTIDDNLLPLLVKKTKLKKKLEIGSKITSKK